MSRFKKNLLKKFGSLIITTSTLVVVYSNCSQSGFTAASNSATINTPAIAPTTTPHSNPGANVMSITVGCGYLNEPCATVTICAPNTNTCQTINNLLIDTGSTGLRVFADAFQAGLPLPFVNDPAGHPYGTCAVYGDSSYQWGPLKRADVQMGHEVASQIPIQIIDFTFGDLGAHCKTLAGPGGIQDARAAGYNGILGVQFFQQDCGSYCANNAGNSIYLGCNGTSCLSETIIASNQLVNPISALPTDNNGLILEFPAIPTTGAANVNGTLTFGIGTQANNSFSTSAVFRASSSGTIYTNLGGLSPDYSAVIDSGSNYYDFPDSNLKPCTAFPSIYCPTALTTKSAIIKDTNKIISQAVSFYITNPTTLNTNSFNTFNDIAGILPSNVSATSVGFIWGFPFFLGRKVFVGFEGKSSNLGTGPYWAF